MSAWHRLGYIDAQELADVKFGEELAILEEHLAHVPRSMAVLVNLGRLPNLGLAEAAEELDNQSIPIALAGQKHVWWHHDASECCRPLPQAVNGPLQLCIQSWVKEPSLAASPSEVTLQVDASGAKSTHACKMVEARMDMEPDQLAIHVKGELRPLFVRQYLDGEAFPDVQQVVPDLLQDLPAAPQPLVPEQEEVPAEAAVGVVPLRAAEEQCAWVTVWVNRCTTTDLRSLPLCFLLEKDPAVGASGPSGALPDLAPLLQVSEPLPLPVITWDKDQSGYITKEELQEVFTRLGCKVSAGDVGKVLKEADADKDSKISYEEFVAWLCRAPHLEHYFKVSEDILRRNMKDVGAMTVKMQKEIEKSKNPMAAMMKMGVQLEARIDKELTPVIKKTFAYHDKDSSGCLSYDESIIFFANYVELVGPFLEATAELSSTQTMQMADVKCNPSKIHEEFKKQFAICKEKHLEKIDEHHKAAFACLDVNKDGKLQESEVLEALLHGHPKNTEFMASLGLLVKPEELMPVAMEVAMDLEECPMQ
ncbi:Calmodulin-related protein [Symbiodinium microadriaticum]|uniref:Calmodulin-related protein n=1 Tax=Symbiodinium microadriaticum TaxID=2951 RepID=A0A1Q9E2F9_SYMMI|nr:Calmodulin-related protein [Symbiodinium microadriaticum]